MKLTPMSLLYLKKIYHCHNPYKILSAFIIFAYLFKLNYSHERLSIVTPDEGLAKNICFNLSCLFFL